MSGNGTTILKNRGFDTLVLSVVVGVIVLIGNTVIPRWVSSVDDAPLTALEVQHLKEKTAELRLESRTDREKLRAEWREQRRESQQAIKALTDAVTDLRFEMQRLRTTIPYLSPGASPSVPEDEAWSG